MNIQNKPVTYSQSIKYNAGTIRKYQKLCNGSGLQSLVSKLFMDYVSKEITTFRFNTWSIQSLLSIASQGVVYQHSFTTAFANLMPEGSSSFKKRTALQCWHALFLHLQACDLIAAGYLFSATEAGIKITKIDESVLTEDWSEEELAAVA